MTAEPVATYETLLVERDGPVATLTMNRPAQLNALYRQSYLDFEQALIWARDDDSVRVVVVTGAGDRAFCAGGDKHLDLPVLSTLGSAGMVADARIAQDTILRIRELHKPVIARVNGSRWAAGTSCPGSSAPPRQGADLHRRPHRRDRGRADREDQPGGRGVQEMKRAED